MQNPGFFSTPLEDAEHEFVEAYILATEYYDLKPPDVPGTGKPKADEPTTPPSAPKTKEWFWKFQINPSTLRHSIGAQYADTQTQGAVTPDSQFFTTEAEKMEVQNAIFDTWQKGKSLRTVLEGLRAMIQPSPTDGMFHPPILSFIWGSMTFGPCVLTSTSWDEVAWLGGEPATVQVSLSLKRVPENFEELASNNPLPIPANTDSNITANSGDETSPPMPLTESQRRQASEFARAYLSMNKASYSIEVQQALRANAYLLLTDAGTGEVKMLRPNGSPFGTIFRWNGSVSSADAKFTVDGVNTIPLSGGVLPDVDISTLEAVSTLIRAGNYNPYSDQIKRELARVAAEMPG